MRDYQQTVERGEVTHAIVLPYDGARVLRDDLKQVLNALRTGAKLPDWCGPIERLASLVTDLEKETR